MKGIFIICSKLWYFWVEIPVIAVLAFSIAVNESSKSVFKLYPLIFVCCAAIVFILLFLFKGISLSFQEIKYVGLFSSKDSADIEEGRTLRLTKKRFNNLEISLYATDDEPVLSWAKREENEEPLVVRMFHGYSSSFGKTTARILKYLGVDAEDLTTILKNSNFNKEYENVNVCCYINEKEEKVIDVLFTKTI